MNAPLNKVQSRKVMFTIFEFVGDGKITQISGIRSFGEHPIVFARR